MVNEVQLPQPADEMEVLRAPAVVEARSIDYVPAAERHGTVLKQSPFWFIGNFQFNTVALGLIGPALGLSLGWSIAAGTAGLLFGTYFMAMHASQGPILGLPQMIQSRPQFGYRGAVLVLAVTLVVFGASSVVATMLISAGLNELFGWNRSAIAVLVVIGSAALAIFGYRWLHRAFQVILFVSAPFYLVLTVAIFLGDAGGGVMSESGFSLTSFMTVFSIGAGYNIAFAPYVSDYSRYLPESTNMRSLVFSVFVGAAGSGIWLMALGSWIASELGVFDVFSGLHLAGNTAINGLGTIIVTLSGVCLIGTLGINNYSAALSALTIIDSFKEVKATRTLRVVANSVFALVILALVLVLPLSYLDTLSNAILFILYLLIPWTAVNLVDFFCVRKGHYSIGDIVRSGGLYSMYSWRGLVAYVVGFLSMIPFVSLSFYMGPAAKALGGVDYAFAVGLIVSGLLYYLTSRSIDLKREAVEVEARNAVFKASFLPKV